MTAISPPPTRPSKFSLYLDLVRWDRPAGWLLLLWPSLAALWLAAGGQPGWHLFLVFVLGVILMRSAGCCINDVADKEFDLHVKRTTLRPITSGLVTVPEALGLGAVLALLAFGLVLTTTRVAVAWSVPALGVAIFYPYSKRFFAMPQAVLGVAFSFGIPMAWAAAQNHVPWEAWVLLLGNLFWVIAYDTEYAMVDRDDDLKIGIKTSAITLGHWDVAAVMACYTLHLLVWLWMGLRHQLSGVFYLGMALAVLQVLWHFSLIRTRTRAGCFTAFTSNHWIGACIFAGVALALR